MNVRRKLAAVLSALLLPVVLPAAAVTAAEATVDMIDFAFDPFEIVVEPGDTVTWTNSDFEAHTATADDGSWSLLVEPGQTASHTFAEGGTVPYFCKFHGGPGGNGMAGVVQVGAPPPPPAVDRLTASDNVGAAIAWSQKAFPEDGSATFALLARQDVFADSLASGAVQGALDAPLLLTDAGSLSAATRSELQRLGVSKVYVLGGSKAVADSVLATLRSDGYAVERVSGSTRVATAVEVARRFFPGTTSAILARGFGDADDPTRAFADSLGAGALASRTAQPVLLTDSGTLSADTRAYLQNSAVEVVTIVGGEAAVSAAVVSALEELGISVERVAGPDRFATAAAIAETIRFSEDGPPVEFQVLVDGSSNRAWASGFPAAVLGSPVVLSSGGELPASTMPTLISTGSEGLQLICAPLHSQRACDRAAVAWSAAPDFSPGFRAAVMEGANDNGELADGQPGVSGLATVRGTDDPRVLCYDAFTFNGLEVGASHIHKGGAGVAGPPVVTLDVTPNGWESPDHFVNCTFGLDPAVVRDVLANPTGYYVNVHTAEFPAGAARGQLNVINTLLGAPMSGEAETPPGDPQGVAFGMIAGTATPGELCTIWFFVGLSEEPMAAHIHEGGSGESGPAVVTLPTPSLESGSASCQMVDPAVFDAIKADPPGHYINIHTDTYPKGAVRGQLTDFLAAFGG